MCDVSRLQLRYGLHRTKEATHYTICPGCSLTVGWASTTSKLGQSQKHVPDVLRALRPLSALVCLPSFAQSCHALSQTQMCAPTQNAAHRGLARGSDQAREGIKWR